MSPRRLLLLREGGGGREKGKRGLGEARERGDIVRGFAWMHQLATDHRQTHTHGESEKDSERGRERINET